MDSVHSAPLNLAARLHRAKIDEQVTALLTTAVRAELGLNSWRDDDPAVRELADIIRLAALRSGPCAINKFALELMELLSESPEARRLWVAMPLRCPD